MGQDDIFIPYPDLSIHLIKDGFAVIADIQPHQRGTIIDGDILPPGVQPDQNGQGPGVRQECTGRFLGHLLQIELTQDETAIEAGDGTKKIIKKPVRTQGAVWSRPFQFAV